MIDNSREEFEDLDPPGDDVRRSGARGGRRSVIVDDSYGGGYLGRPEPARTAAGAEPSRGGALDREGAPARGAAAAARGDVGGLFEEGVRRPSRTARGEPEIDFDAPRGRSAAPAPAAARRETRGREAPTGADRAASGADRTAAGRRARARAPEPDARRSGARGAGSGGVWAWATLASVLWVAGVCAFTVGYLRLPIEPPAALIDAAGTIEPRLWLMIGAVAFAPLGVIWTAALTARRARAIAFEAHRIGEIATRASGAAAGGGAGLDQGAIDALAGRIGGDIDAVEARLGETLARFDGVEARLGQALARLEGIERRFEDGRGGSAAEDAERRADREAVARMARDVEGELARLRDSVGEMRAAEQRGPSEAMVAAIAAAVAARLSAAGSAPARGEPAESVRAEAGRMRAPYSAVAPERAQPARSAQTPPATSLSGERDTPARAAVRRAAQAAAATIGDRRGAAAAPGASAGYGDDGYDDAEDAFDPEFDDVAEAAPSRAGAAAAGAGSLGAGSAKSAGGFDWAQFVKAANFPESDDDRETLDALYKVIKDPEVAELLQSAEDVLSALADLDLYMDDMQPHHAPAKRWEAFAVRGDLRDAIELGGVRDPHAIEDVVNALHDRAAFARMAETFLDRYAAMLRRLFDEAPSGEVAVELADTRTGRAYMLLARAAGRFG